MTTNKNDIGRIVSSKKRYVALKALAEEPLTPTALANTTKLYRSDVSHALSALRDMGAAELVVAETRRKGRIHGITDYGEELLEEIDDDMPNLRPDAEHTCPVCGQATESGDD